MQINDEYKNIKKIVIKSDYTKEDKRKIDLFKEQMNECFKDQKDNRSFIKFLNDFNKAIDDLPNNREEFIASSETLFNYFKGLYRR